MHRVVGAVVAELELVGLAAQRQPEDLVAEADAEHRQLRPRQLARRFDRVADRGRDRRGRSTGRRRPASCASTSRAGVVAGTTRDPAARRAQPAQDAALDAEVVGDDVEALGRRLARRRVRRGRGRACPHRFVPFVAGRGASPRAPGRAPPATGACARARRRRAASSTARVMTARCAPDSRMRRVTARVSMPEMPATPWSASSECSEPDARQFDTSGDSSRTTKPGAPRARRLEVDRVDAHVADLRRRHGDDLPAVRRIGQHLLVAGDRGVEHDLARAVAAPRRSRTRGRRCRPPWRAAREAAVESWS